jgi:hypothetical protein
MAAGIFMISCAANAEIMVPSIVSETDTNHYSTASTAALTNNSGMTPAVNAGDSLEEAIAAIHANTGVFESWVTEASAPDYFGGFGGTNPPVIVWDVTGAGDTLLLNIILWQYQNDGGGNNQVGNHARTIEMQFNTEDQGADVFAGAVTTIMALPTLTGDNNIAQAFQLPAGMYRYVQMTITDNHAGDPDGVGVNATVGGDRVGLGEVRFDVISPAAWMPDVSQTDGASAEVVDATLMWNTGRTTHPTDANEVMPHPNLLKHVVYISTGSATDPNVYYLDEVPAEDPVEAEASYGTVELLRSTTYYWRVDEVTDANTFVGDLWSFTTLASDPGIDSAPAHQYVAIGQSATFSIVAINPFTDDSEGLSYEWHRVDATEDTVVGGNSESYTTPAATADDDGSRYYCVVSIAEPDVEASATSSEAFLVIKDRIAYWPFDGDLKNVDDATGVTDGTAAGEPGFVEGLVNAGQALAVDGDDYVSISNDDLAWSPTGSFSVSVWGNVAAGSGGHRAIVSNRHEPPVQGFILYAQPGDTWGLWTGADGWAGPGNGGGVPFVSGEWIHLAITFEPTGTSGENIVGTSTLYVNGVKERVLEGDLYRPKELDTSDFYIGAGRNERVDGVSGLPLADYFFNGLIDDVRIYNHAIDHDKVATLYTDVVGPACIYGNPAADVTGPEGVPDCAVDLYDFAEFASQWLNHGYFPYRPGAID